MYVYVSTAMTNTSNKTSESIHKRSNKTGRQTVMDLGGVWEEPGLHQLLSTHQKENVSYRDVEPYHPSREARSSLSLKKNKLFFVNLQLLSLVVSGRGR